MGNGGIYAILMNVLQLLHIYQKKMIHLPIKLINEVINHCNPNNNNLKRTLYPML